MSKYMKNMKKGTKKRIKLYSDDVWDVPSGARRKGERYYRRECD